MPSLCVPCAASTSTHTLDLTRPRPQRILPLRAPTLPGQVFNEVNARRINDELLTFEGIHRSPIFLAVVAVTAGLQAIIMQTPLGMFFKVGPLTAAEWGVSVAIGATALPLSFLTRLAGRLMPGGVRRRRGRRTLSGGARRTSSLAGGRGLGSAGASARVHDEGTAALAAAAAVKRRSVQRGDTLRLSGGAGGEAGPREVPRLPLAAWPAVDDGGGGSGGGAR